MIASLYLNIMSIIKKLQGKPVKEGMDDADDGSPGPDVSGPKEATNLCAEMADGALQAAERLAGFIDRRANAGNPKLLARIQNVYHDLSDICAEIEGMNANDSR